LSKASLQGKIKSVFESGHGYARLRDLTDAAIHPYQLRKLETGGKIVKVARGLYRWDSHPIANEMTEVSHLVPKGVFCLFSALAFYELTTYVPHQHHLAIERSQKATLPTYPPIKLYFWSRKAQETGIITQPVDGETINTIRIYDREKTLCDTIKYRHKVGKDLTNEVLRNYLKRKDRNLDKLLSYAKVLRVHKILQEYLSVLL
jgi:predicted transcriptional regulator of viral defense system